MMSRVANVSAYPVTTHNSDGRVVWKSARIVGIATFSTVLSRTTMNAAMSTTESATQRLGSSCSGSATRVSSTVTSPRRCLMRRSLGELERTARKRRSGSSARRPSRMMRTKRSRSTGWRSPATAVACATPENNIETSPGPMSARIAPAACARATSSDTRAQQPVARLGGRGMAGLVRHLIGEGAVAGLELGETEDEPLEGVRGVGVGQRGLGLVRATSRTSRRRRLRPEPAWSGSCGTPCRRRPPPGGRPPRPAP